MIYFYSHARAWLLASVFFGLLHLPLVAAPERNLQTPPSVVMEVRTLIRLLEEIHYNRDAVTPSSYVEVIPDFMADLDGQHLFFLNSDRMAFLEKYKPDILYWNITSLGKIDPAYEVYTLYEKRVNARIDWIMEQLKNENELSLKSDETYELDRAKAEWPETLADADALWQKRLKFELLKEMLNKKTAEEARTNVRKRYTRMLKNLYELETKDIYEMFLGTIAHMYDPHSTYFSADTYEDFGIQMRLQLVGIGALLSIDEDICVVKELIPGGPADLDKRIKPNDHIVSVAQGDGDPVEVIGMKLRKIVDLIRGTKGTKVRLMMESPDGAGTSVRKEIVITRDVVNLDSARAHAAIFEVPAVDGKISNVGVITLPAFYGPDLSGDDKAQNSATKDIAELIKRLKEKNIQGLVLDLRQNGGGLLSEAITLTGLFIKAGPVVQVRSYSGDIKVDSDDDDSVAYGGPLTVLVSRFSASASEIVAGALQNYGRAVIVGDSSTHGKGSVQQVVEMKNIIPQLAKASVKSGATKLTVQKFYLPNGSSTQLKGVVPDIILPSLDDYLPIGESSLTHTLGWDEIRSSRFDGVSLTNEQLTPLRLSSQGRQKSLEEFSYLQRNIDWFKTRQQQKVISLNLDQRLKQKEADAAFRKEQKAERKRLGKLDYKFTEVMLAPPPPKRIKAEDKTDDAAAEEEDSVDENERFTSMDIPLREALRVVTDLLQNPLPMKVPTLNSSSHTASTTPPKDKETSLPK